MSSTTEGSLTHHRYLSLGSHLMRLPAELRLQILHHVVGNKTLLTTGSLSLFPVSSTGEALPAASNPRLAQQIEVLCHVNTTLWNEIEEVQLATSGLALSFPTDGRMAQMWMAGTPLRLRRLVRAARVQVRICLSAHQREYRTLFGSDQEVGDSVVSRSAYQNCKMLLEGLPGLRSVALTFDPSGADITSPEALEIVMRTMDLFMHLEAFSLDSWCGKRMLEKVPKMVELGRESEGTAASELGNIALAEEVASIRR